MKKIISLLLAFCIFTAAAPFSAQAVSAPARASISSASANSCTKITVKWKKIKGVSGYQLRCSKSSKMSKPKSFTVSKGVSKSVSKLSAGKRYYFQVRAYKKVGKKKKYGKWSKSKSALTYYSVTYKLGGGTQAKGQKTSFTSSTPTFSLKFPTRQGYTFDGWFTSDKYTKRALQVKKGTKSNQVFYAKWSREYSLSNKNSNYTTQQVYNYINKTFKTASLSAQQESYWIEPDYEMNYLISNTGKLPAIRGFDYMNDDFEGVNKRAAEWWKKGGLVTICWHTGSDFCGEWNDAMNDSFDNWTKALTQGTEENRQLIEGMDKAAKALLELQKQGVTVVWRPFHEFDGGWFWWGKNGSLCFRDLWKLMYKRYTEYWKLNNLIWVLGYSHNGEDENWDCKKWYPGNEYCDVIGADSYSPGAHEMLWAKISALQTGKPLCLHECGENPTSDELKSVGWAWFMTWHTNYLTEENTAENLNKLYNSDYVITLDELPSSNWKWAGNI
ncbi:MAG: fibronectin type III domain-containing protein [Eubacterium sp.]|nr:fibronectin type III domain-containing protein [Eubacterium sp.]